ncbi:MAG: acetate/propionate family kinase [Candidatus Muiribacteriota bacterium]
MRKSKKESKKILVINCGSSSLKYELFNLPVGKSIAGGVAERIGEKKGSISLEYKDKKIKKETVLKDHKMAVKNVMELLMSEENKIIKEKNEIAGIGHRVVHGGETYSNSVVINEDVENAIRDNIELAPLHNPANLTGIKALKEFFPDIPHVGVFDTSFHQTLKPSAYLYALPREFYTKHRIRKYGFHGTSHRYVASEALKILKRPKKFTNLITCHLGNGASITAVEGGKSIDTSMGFTPLAGLVMGTRCGDIDPAIIPYLYDRGYSMKEITTILNKKSGLLGLTGISNDLRDLELEAEKGNKKVIDALETYAYSIRKYIGAYSANLYKVDILVFTGGIGENGWRMRERVCHRLENIGIVMDYNKNREIGSGSGVISEPYSHTVIAVVPTNEELQIAKDTYKLI